VDSQVRRSLWPDSYGWDTHADLLAYIADLLAGANYQRSGGKGQKPKPVPRPSENKQQQTSHNQGRGKGKQVGSGSGFEPELMTQEEAAAWLGIDI